MSRIDVCLLSHGQPSSNPRLVRDADALSEAGFSVRVVTSRLLARWVEHDQALTRHSLWDHEWVDCLEGMGSKLRWSYFRIRIKMARWLFRHWPNSWALTRAVNYANPELGRLASEKPARLYIAHQHHALPAACRAAAMTGGLLAFDAEDLLSECSSEPVDIMRALEQRYLSKCSYISTMSDVAAERLLEANGLKQRPLVLHNTPRLREREGVVSPESRRSSCIPSLYWFGQSIGPHSCAEVVLQALSRVGCAARLTLRGNPVTGYINHLQALASRLGIAERLSILPVASPESMVSLSAEHDILLGTQPGDEMFHQMAIGNKVFTGMMAGCALALNDTLAHRRLVRDLPPMGFLYRDGDVAALAEALKSVLSSPEKLIAYKTNAWRMAEQRFNWGHESKALVATVAELLQRAL